MHTLNTTPPDRPCCIARSVSQTHNASASLQSHHCHLVISLMTAIHLRNFFSAPDIKFQETTLESLKFSIKRNLMSVEGMAKEHNEYSLQKHVTQ